MHRMVRLPLPIVLHALFLFVGVRMCGGMHVMLLTAFTTCPMLMLVLAPCVCPCSPAGEYEKDNACEACRDGWYRSGESTPDNNVCKPIPAGAP